MKKGAGNYICLNRISFDGLACLKRLWLSKKTNRFNAAAKKNVDFMAEWMNDNEAKEMFKNLDLYCGQDTYAMVLLMKVLYDTIK